MRREREKGTYNAALRNHRLQILCRQRLLTQVDEIDFEGVHNNVAGHEKLIRLAESEEFERPHQPLVLFYSFTHLGGGGRTESNRSTSDFLVIFFVVCDGLVAIVNSAEPHLL